MDSLLYFNPDLHKMKIRQGKGGRQVVELEVWVAPEYYIVPGSSAPTSKKSHIISMLKKRTATSSETRPTSDLRTTLRLVVFNPTSTTNY